jgi:hypothetical protein
MFSYAIPLHYNQWKLVDRATVVGQAVAGAIAVGEAFASAPVKRWRRGRAQTSSVK